jgi:hypothetical protein
MDQNRLDSFSGGLQLSNPTMKYSNDFRSGLFFRRLKPSVQISPSPVWGKAGMGADTPAAFIVGARKKSG